MPGIIALLLTIISLAVLIAAVHFRWLSRFSRGFLLTLLVSIVGTGVASSSLAGIWGFQSAREIITQESIAALESLGQVIEKELHGALNKALTQMSELSTVLAPNMGSGDYREAQERIDLLKLNRRIIQLDLHDNSGQLLAGSGPGEGTEPINRVAAAFALEGRSFISDPYLSTVFNKHVIYLSVPVNSPGGEVVGSMSMRVDLDEAFSGLLESTRFGKSGYVVLVNHDGLIVAHPDRSRTGADISGYRAVQLGLNGEQGSLVDRNEAGRERFFFYRPMKSPGTINPKPMLLMAEMDEDEASSSLRYLKYKLLLGAGLIMFACLAIALQLSHYIKKPLQELLHMVEQVQEGDLAARAHSLGRDEFGQLGTALNKMAEGLQERDMVKEVFGRYVTTQVSEEVLKGKINLGGESRRVTILFSDIRNFTAMAEQMEPTQVVDFLNDYFSEMVEAVFEFGGVLDKFMGDGMMAVFGSFGDEPDHPRRAVMAALRMKALLAKINGRRSIRGKPPINIGIGIHTDEVIIGNIGSHKRLDYTVVGDGVNTTSRIEALNKQFNTTILVTSETFDEVGEFFNCRLMPEAQVKGKARTLQVYEVLSIKP